MSVSTIKNINACLAYAGGEGLALLQEGAQQDGSVAGFVLHNIYAPLIADPAASFREKAAMGVTAAVALHSDSLVLEFHNIALSRAVHRPESREEPVRLGYMLASRESDLSPADAGWTIGHDAFHMAKVCTIAAQGRNNGHDLAVSIGQALESGVERGKLAYAIKLSTAFGDAAGALRATRVLDGIASNPPAPVRPSRLLPPQLFSGPIGCGNGVKR